MRRIGKHIAGLVLLVLLAGCGTPAVSATPTPTATAFAAPTASASGSAAPTATPSGAPTQADLTTVEKLLYPPSSTGTGDCLSSSQGPPSAITCPVTQRLAAALSAALNDPNGAADPLCGCQAIDPHQTATYTPGTPPAGGTIHVTAFGSPQTAYVVIRSTGQLLVDDILYCSPSPHSIYTAEKVTAC